MHGRPQIFAKRWGPSSNEPTVMQSYKDGYATPSKMSLDYTVAGSDEISAAHDWLTGKT